MNDNNTISAINRVLQAESESRESMEHCREQAAEIIENGRSQARRIGNRVDDRISTINAIADMSIDRRLAILRQEMASLSSEPAMDDRTRIRLQTAVEAMVIELVGEVS